MSSTLMHAGNVEEFLDVDWFGVTITNAGIRNVYVGRSLVKLAGYAYDTRDDKAFDDWIALTGSPFILKVAPLPGLKERIISAIHAASMRKIVLIPHKSPTNLCSGNQQINMGMLLDVLEGMGLDNFRLLEYGMKSPWRIYAEKEEWYKVRSELSKNWFDIGFQLPTPGFIPLCRTTRPGARTFVMFGPLSTSLLHLNGKASESQS